MKLYNSLTKQKEELKPLKEKVVNLYTCGPTVYDYAHIGNLRTYIFEDLLIRALLYNGYKVNHVINITDIGHLTSDSDQGEDKMVKALKREGLELSVESMQILAEKYTAAFKQDIEKLNVFQIKDKNYNIKWVKATAHIKEMIELTKTLLEKGNAYETEHAIYFDVSTFKEYTKLSGQKLEDKLVAVREEVEEDPEKKHAADFVLWFKLAGKHKDHLMNWPSPWGEGFPGWHIECSAMAMKHLGETLDIHTGGIDHVPLHHTNEIAQSEAATGKEFSNMWLHGEFLDLNKAKMAKSAGTFITLQDLIDKGYDPLAYRYFTLGTHYRQKLNFSWEAIDGAQNALHKLYREVKDFDKPEVGCAEYEEKFLADISDDLNLPKSLALIWDLLKNEEFPTSAKAETLYKFDEVLGIDLQNKHDETVDVPKAVQLLLEEREQARNDKDWSASDSLRNKMSELGWEVEDTADGQKVNKK